MWGEAEGFGDNLDEQLSALRGLLDGDGDFDTTGGAIPRLAPGAIARASFAQRQLWFLHTIDPTCTAYHVPLTFSIRGGLDEQCLRRSFQLLIERHDALRTRFVQQG